MKKRWKVLSFILQGAYCLFCILDIVICLVYRYNYDTELGTSCANLALSLTMILFMAPALPLGTVLNILAAPSDQPKITRRRWRIWTIISPCVYLIFCLAAVCVFVGSTGGV